MNYQTFPPSASLARYLRCYWTLESGQLLTEPSRERIFPDGCIELIFHFGDLFKKHEAEGADLQARAFLHGQLKKYMEIERTGVVGIFSVRFNPGGLQPFVNFSVSDITGRTITVEEAWQQEGQQLKKQVLGAATHAERIAAVETFLLQRLTLNFPGADIVDQSIATILQHEGNVSPEQLAHELKVSKRHLERLFQAAVGLSPKVLCRIIRFNRALQLIERKDFQSFTTVAHEGGFYDQAHFIKDFKAITGLNPKQYFSEDLEMVRFFNL